MLFIFILVGCGKNDNNEEKETFIEVKENPGNVNLEKPIEELSKEEENTSTVETNSIYSLVNIEKIEMLANEFKSNYIKGAFLGSSTKKTIEIARALKTNMSYSADEKITIIKQRYPTAMAQWGAEMALYMSELERDDLTQKDKARLLRNMSNIYNEFWEKELAVEYMEKAADIYKEIGSMIDLAKANSAIAQYYSNNIDDYDNAIEHYKNALEYSKDYEGDDFHKDNIQYQILVMLCEQGKREEVKECYEVFSKSNPEKYADCKRFIDNPNGKLKLGKVQLSITGSSYEIPGLPELISTHNNDEIHRYLRLVLAKMIEEEKRK